MTTIALHKYHEQINQLLEDSHYDLAAEHCRHILQQHPQHIATYRLLAKTQLEKGDYDGARELFQRILSADPNDHIAHAGLAIIFKEEDVPAQAIWHLERAYEIEPYNTAIQQELRSLYVRQIENQRKGQKNGDTAVIPTTLLLTKGALARLYLRGELFDQATAVLRAALAADEERIDLRVLLMEALWRDGRRMEAVNVALVVLDQLPNCIAANAVLAEIWLRTGRVDEAQSYLQRLQALLLLDASHYDPEAPEGSAFRAEGAIPLPKVVEVDYLGAEGAQVEFEEKPAWQPTPLADGDQPDLETDDDMYQWLEGLTGELPPLEEPETAVDRADAYESDMLRQQTKPQSDWLATLIEPEEDEASDFDLVAGGMPGQEPDSDAQAGLLAHTADADDLGHTPGASEAVDDFAPDWLADLAADDLDPLQIDSQTAAAWLREDQLAEVEDDLQESDAFDWLESPADEKADSLHIDSESGALDLSQFGDFQTDWDDEEEPEEEFEWRLTDELTAMSAEPDEDDEHAPEMADGLAALALGDETGLPDDIPDWLMTGSQTGDLYEETKPATDDLADELADWVAAKNSELLDDEADDWLAAAESDASEVSEAGGATPESGPLPDWLNSDFIPDSVDSRLLGTDRLADEPADVAEDDPFADGLISDGLPDWLQEDEKTAVDPDNADLATGDLPAWLRGASLDALASTPLDETKVDDYEQAAPEALPEEAEDLEAPMMSDMLRAAVELDLSTADALAAEEDLPGWLFADEAAAADARAADLKLDVEDVVSDKKEEKFTGPDDEQSTQPEQPLLPDDEMDWLDDLTAMTDSDTSGLDVLNDTGELPDWMVLDEAELVGAQIEEEPAETAVSEADESPLPDLPPDVPLDEDADLNWLDALAAEEAQAEPVEELPTWQWPEDQPAEDAAEDDLMQTLLALEDSEGELEAAAPADVEFPDDLDDAMSWLEELAGEPDAPVEELPTVAQDMDMDFDDLFAADLTTGVVEETPAEAEQFELPPEDPEAAMAWLEQLAARQGASLDELPSVQGAVEASAEPEADIEPDADDLLGAEATLIAAGAVGAHLVRETEDTADTAVDAGEDVSLEVPEDPDEAMAWLERLAARQGAPLDELPSITDEADLDDLLAQPAAAEMDDEELDFFALEDDLEPEADAAEIFGLADEDEDLDWLETIGAAQEAALPEPPMSEEAFGAEEMDLIAGEAPGAADSDALDDLTEAMDWLDGLAEMDDETETAVPDWLQAETPEPEPESEPARPPVMTPALLAELAWLEEEIGLEADAASLAELDAEDVDISDDELNAALEQLDQLVLTPAATSAAPEAEAEVLPEDLADLSAELDELLALAEDLPEEADVDATLVTAVVVEDNVALDEEIDLVEAAVEPDLDLEAIPDDPDEAMAWLERLAARQGASLDELPSLYDADEETLAALTAVPEAQVEPEEPEAPVEPETAAAELDVPENIDDAMAWLEQLAARQGASLDELPSVTEVADEVETPDWIAAQSSSAADVLEEVDTVEDLETMEDWTTPSEETAVADTAEAALGVPDDIDDAMAWLEQLAARQGASLDELPSVTDETAVDDLDAPAWITAALDVAAAETVIEKTAADDEADLSPADEGPSDLDEVDDSLPDWLIADVAEDQQRVVGHTDWLGALPEPDLDSWLAAEEEATMTGTGSFQGEPRQPATGKTGPLSPRVQTGPLSEASLPDTGDLEDDLLIPDLDLGMSAVELDQDRLQTAREALHGGQVEAALESYASLVETGEGLNTLIADLEAASSQHADRPLVRRMLGDAYMRNGQLQKALETYRQALDQM